MVGAGGQTSVLASATSVLGHASGAFWMLRALRAVARDIGWGPVLRSLPRLAAVARGRVEGAVPDARKHRSAILYAGLVRNGMQMRGGFRFGGSFHTAMGSLVSWDNAIRGARVGTQVKQKYIDDGVLFDDGADNAWGGLYEGGAFSHLEERACYDDDRWQQKIKAALDPANAADASFYTDPAFEKNPPARYLQQVERVRAGRARVVIDRAPASARAPARMAP